MSIKMHQLTAGDLLRMSFSLIIAFMKSCRGYALKAMQNHFMYVQQYCMSY